MLRLDIACGRSAAVLFVVELAVLSLAVLVGLAIVRFLLW